MHYSKLLPLVISTRNDRTPYICSSSHSVKALAMVGAMS